MILMKEYVSLTTAAMKMGKQHSILNHPGHVILTSWTFFQIFTSGRHHRDMKMLKN